VTVRGGSAFARATADKPVFARATAVKLLGGGHVYDHASLGM